MCPEGPEIGFLDQVCEVSGFRRDAVEDFAFLGSHAAWVGSCLLTFRDSLSVQSSGVMDCLTLDDGACILSRNVGKELATYCRKTSERSEGLKVFVFNQTVRCTHISSNTTMY